MLSAVTTILARDLDTLRREVELYPDDMTPWALVPGLPNTGGTLVLHLVGNLRHFIGTVLGHGNYVRDWEAEFGSRGLSRAELAAGVNAARDDVDRALAGLPEASLAAPFPVSVGGVSLSTERMLLHLVAHLAYHLGQIDYHRRAVTGSPESAGTMPLGPLAGSSGADRAGS